MNTDAIGNGPCAFWRRRAIEPVARLRSPAAVAPIARFRSPLRPRADTAGLDAAGRFSSRRDAHMSACSPRMSMRKVFPQIGHWPVPGVFRWARRSSFSRSRCCCGGLLLMEARRSRVAPSLSCPRISPPSTARLCAERNMICMFAVSAVCAD